MRGFVNVLDNLDRTVTCGPTTLTLAGGDSLRCSRPPAHTTSRRDPLIAPDDQRIMLSSFPVMPQPPQVLPQTSSLKEHEDDEIKDGDSSVPPFAGAPTGDIDRLIIVKDREWKP